MKPVVKAFAGPESAGLWFYCPGCRKKHAVWTHSLPGKAVWSFNGLLEKPTFSPSILVTRTEGSEQVQKVCHSFVRNGRIEYLSDCTHALAGQTVEMVGFPFDD